MDSKKAILATLVYSDIFNYPLTEDEMWKYLITSEKVGFCKESLEKTLKQLSTKITKQNNFYCLTGREEIVTQRLSKQIINQKKLVIAKRIARILNFIPTVQLIGLSGGLAMENADVTDDIDFFVITKKNTLWMTRFCLLILLAILGKRREHNKQEKKDSVCINMLVDEQSLQLPSKRQDLYTAHEVIQMKVLFEREGMYRRFIKANEWIKKYLPNASLSLRGARDTAISSHLTHKIASFLAMTRILEIVAKYFQLWYMKNHRTNETISDSMLAFHPKDYRDIVEKEYNKRLKIYGI